MQQDNNNQHHYQHQHHASNQELPEQPNQENQEHRVAQIVEVKFVLTSNPENGQSRQQARFFVQWACECCQDKARWVSKQDLVQQFQVEEPKLKMLEEQAIKELKERETRKHAEELMKFLFFDDVADFKQVQESDFEEINFYPIEDTDEQTNWNNQEEYHTTENISDTFDEESLALANDIAANQVLIESQKESLGAADQTRLHHSQQAIIKTRSHQSKKDKRQSQLKEVEPSTRRVSRRQPKSAQSKHEEHLSELAEEVDDCYNNLEEIIIKSSPGACSSQSHSSCIPKSTVRGRRNHLETRRATSDYHHSMTRKRDKKRAIKALSQDHNSDCEKDPQFDNQDLQTSKELFDEVQKTLEEIKQHDLNLQNPGTYIYCTQKQSMKIKDQASISPVQEQTVIDNFFSQQSSNSKLTPIKGSTTAACITDTSSRIDRNPERNNLLGKRPKIGFNVQSQSTLSYPVAQRTRRQLINNHNAEINLCSQQSEAATTAIMIANDNQQDSSTMSMPSLAANNLMNESSSNCCLPAILVDQDKSINSMGLPNTTKLSSTGDIQDKKISKNKRFLVARHC